MTVCALGGSLPGSLSPVLGSVTNSTRLPFASIPRREEEPAAFAQSLRAWDKGLILIAIGGSYSTSASPVLPRVCAALPVGKATRRWPWRPMASALTLCISSVEEPLISVDLRFALASEARGLSVVCIPPLAAPQELRVAHRDVYFPSSLFFFCFLGGGVGAAVSRAWQDRSSCRVEWSGDG